MISRGGRSCVETIPISFEADNTILTERKARLEKRQARSMFSISGRHDPSWQKEARHDQAIRQSRLLILMTARECVTRSGLTEEERTINRKEARERAAVTQGKCD